MQVVCGSVTEDEAILLLPAARMVFAAYNKKRSGGRTILVVINCFYSYIVSADFKVGGFKVVGVVIVIAIACLAVYFLR